MICECGADIKKSYYKKHLLTKKHLKWLEAQKPILPASACEPPKKDNPLLLGFAKQLALLNIPPLLYIKEARANAVKYGYDLKLLQFSNKNCYKLIYDNKYNLGIVNFSDGIIHRLKGTKGVYQGSLDSNTISELTRRILWDIV